MLAELRAEFNSTFSEEKYRRFLNRMHAIGGTQIPFRISETPVFFPRNLLEKMALWGSEMIGQLMDNREYLDGARRLIPDRFRALRENPHPLFVAVDFGIATDENGDPAPKLIELQGFPTMFVYQTILTQQYKEVFDLPRSLTSLLSGLSTDDYLELLRNVILGSHDPENVVLLELDPHHQKTRVDFILTDRVCGIRTVNKRDLIKNGRKLFYREDGRLIRILRIYNRAIADEIVRSGAQLPFNFSDDVDVEWAGHPNWYFILSKYSIPFLNHPAVPKTFLLSSLKDVPEDLAHWVLKPLFSFAGSGVIMGPSKKDLENIPADQRGLYILQERVDYRALVETPHGATKAEIRIIYFWTEDRPVPVNNLVRMGRGKMMGVDHNKDMLWVGSSAVLYLP